MSGGRTLHGLPYWASAKVEESSRHSAVKQKTEEKFPRQTEDLLAFQLVTREPVCNMATVVVGLQGRLGKGTVQVRHNWEEGEMRMHEHTDGQLRRSDKGPMVKAVSGKF